MNADQIQAFDPDQPYSVISRRLPHWAQAGTACFITWRTADSMPRDVVDRWIAERNALLELQGIHVNHAGFTSGGIHWKQRVNRLAPGIWWKLECALTDQ